jgi:hypothetical protein
MERNPTSNRDADAGGDVTMKRWTRPPLIFVSLVVVALALWAFFRDPKVDYCFADTSPGDAYISLRGHRTLALDRNYGEYRNVGDMKQVAAVLGCNFIP